ncbi:hypothetical protein BpHYR1_006511, partial [Brachionus plicatilis]
STINTNKIDHKLKPKRTSKTFFLAAKWPSILKLAICLGGLARGQIIFGRVKDRSYGSVHYLEG